LWDGGGEDDRRREVVGKWESRWGGGISRGRGKTVLGFSTEGLPTTFSPEASPPLECAIDVPTAISIWCVEMKTNAYNHSCGWSKRPTRGNKRPPPKLFATPGPTVRKWLVVCPAARHLRPARSATRTTTATNHAKTRRNRVRNWSRAKNSSHLRRFAVIASDLPVKTRALESIWHAPA